MNIPANIRAGDTIEWTESSSDYPAGNNYTLAIDLRAKDKAPITITASANNNDYDVAITPAVSAKYVAGNYTYQAYVYKSANNVVTEKYTLQTGQIEILPNLSGQDSQYDPRSHAKKVLDAIEAVIEGKATSDVLSYSIAGRSLSRMTASELTEWRSFYQDEYQKECETEAVAKGENNPKRIGVRFNRV